MQTHCLPNLSDTPIVDSSTHRVRRRFRHAQSGETISISVNARLIPSRKLIALVAHDNRKEQLASWALKHRTRLIEHELYATSHTADIIAEALNAPVFRFLRGSLGGDQQIGSRIAESKIDVLVFFWDPLGHQPHDSDVKALLRLATAYNLLFDPEHQAVRESPNHNLLTVKETSRLLAPPALEPLLSRATRTDSGNSNRRPLED